MTIVRRTLSKTKAKKPTKEQAKQLRALKRMKDEDIDFSDIPALTGNEQLVVGKFYRPIKK